LPFVTPPTHPLRADVPDDCLAAGLSPPARVSQLAGALAIWPSHMATLPAGFGHLATRSGYLAAVKG
jgi:hypothetical protein